MTFRRAHGVPPGWAGIHSGRRTGIDSRPFDSGWTGIVHARGRPGVRRNTLGRRDRRGIGHLVGGRTQFICFEAWREGPVWSQGHSWGALEGKSGARVRCF